MVAATVIVAVGAYMVVLGPSDTGRALTNSTTLNNRLAYWGNSVAMILDRPWGQGVGGYWAAYPFYHDALVDTPILGEAYNENYRPRSAHNDALTLLAETGPGAVLLALVLLVAVRERGPAHLGLLAFLLCGLFAFPLLVPASAFLAAVCCGYLYSPRGHLLGRVDRWGALLLRRAARIFSRRSNKRIFLSDRGKGFISPRGTYP